MIELGFATTESSASVCIIPKGIIDSYASKMSHQLFYNFNMNKLVRGRYIMDDVTLEEAAKKFIDFLRETKEKTGMSPILLCHGKDHITLLNNLAAVGMDDALLEVIGGAMNFLNIICDDPEFENKSKSLTKLKDEKNLSEIILGDKISRQEIVEQGHDAHFDAGLLMKVFEAYLNPPWSCSLEFLMENYLIQPDALKRVAITSIKNMQLKRMRKLKPRKSFLLFNGWDEQDCV